MTRYITAQCGPDLICKAVVESHEPLVPPPGETFIPVENTKPAQQRERWNVEKSQFEKVVA